MGYPPRKAGETSIGDAINWEWIIDCTTACQKDLILVSRDTDYGTPYGNPPVLNDWLSQEFNERCKGRAIVLTDRLSYAFKCIQTHRDSCDQGRRRREKNPDSSSLVALPQVFKR